MADLGITGLLSTVSANTEDAAQAAVDKWLSMIGSAVGDATHITTMLSVEQLTVGTNPLVNPQQPEIHDPDVQLTASPEMVKWYNELFKLTAYPNIEGIVIFADKESGSRRVDVSEQPLVTQADEGSTVYAMDNAVPHPREWSLSGYIMSNLATDHYYILKPSIVAQKTYLDMCMRSRRPVWFKTYDNVFVKALITSFDYNWDPKAMNGLQVSISLKEFVPFTVYSGLAAPTELAAVGKYKLI